MASVLSDLVWHNTATGEVKLWFLDGLQVAAQTTVLMEDGRPAAVGTPWGIVRVGDMTGDGKADLVWHNVATGEIQTWIMDGTRVAGRATVLMEDGRPAAVGAPWGVVGVGDMTGDGKADLVWHNSATGEVQLWLMNGPRVTGRATVLKEDGRPAAVGTPWGVVGVGDMAGDGKADLVWHNSATGEVQLWLMNGPRVTGRSTVVRENGQPEVVGSPWHIVGVGDMRGNGEAEIVWHNPSTGEVQLWGMAGPRVDKRLSLRMEDGRPAAIGRPWGIVGVGVFSKSGDGRRYYRAGQPSFFVQGAIVARYAEMGGPTSWLGWPTNNEIPLAGGGRFSTFERGYIYWWPDVGAIEMANVSVRYKGLYCFGETDELSPHDEPYAIFGILAPPPLEPPTVMTQTYTDVDGGDSRPDNLEVYRGPPHGLRLGVALWEHDHSDQNKYLEQVKQGVALARRGVGALCGVIAGPEAVPVCESGWDALSQDIVKFVNGIVGTDDDLIERWVWDISVKEMVTLPRHRPSEFWGIEYHLASKLLSDGEASYKLYLAVYPV